MKTLKVEGARYKLKEEKKVEAFEVEGAVRVGEAVQAIILLIVGVGIAALLLVFVATLGGQAYSQVQADINAIADAEVKNYVIGAAKSGFKAMNTTGNELPLVAMAIAFAITIGVIIAMLSFANFGGYGYGGYGGVL